VLSKIRLAYAAEPVMSGFGALAELPWERVTDKIERRVLAGQQGILYGGK
jgi:hypothetical protein